MSKNKYTFIQKICSDADIETYLPQLNINGTISMKMKKLCQITVLSKDDIDNRQRILDYIRSLFQPFYPDCLLIAFGSTINGFGTKGGDMDMMFSPSSDYEHLDASEINDDGGTPIISDARENPSVMAQLKNMSKEKQLRFLLRVLRRNRNEIKGAVYIPAKCPIVKFIVSHNYDVWCDLSFQHGLAKYNTELLRFFSVLDSRIKPLMITLRFWARHLKIVKTGAFSSYAFNLLVIFFLQNLEEPILPPVTDLMINAGVRSSVHGLKIGHDCNSS
ncbi:Speckle targeted PIP5K1A-regulated poly(A) polymerase [Araneus ventricosus]|uniref:Speckle targeted PIP5K1A-regulated poly(A) polymerase n=1 Tax=Araneus ventricosus TaxID=182803 RepID=A0A4Y2DPL0_ARAVE|nr:Speckle targeted PIP5K1A-regulated poly(A) polymerase [Araneus ventricosus]